MSECGDGKCVHGHDRQDRETIRFCGTHQAENDTTRRRWAEDHQRLRARDDQVGQS